jgi:hypothetical protein
MVKYIIEKRKICSSNVKKIIGYFFECENNIKQQLKRNGCSLCENNLVGRNITCNTQDHGWNHGIPTYLP